jgi:hypothetical protein
MRSFTAGLCFNYLKNTISILLVGILSACSSTQVGKYSTQGELVEAYLSDFTRTTIEIVFERGHNSLRIVAFHKNHFSELHMFRDKQEYKTLKIDEGNFKELLSRSLTTAGSLYRKPANKEEGPCRTPFLITLKKQEEVFSVKGCRAAEEGTLFGKLIADIEHLVSASKF